MINVTIIVLMALLAVTVPLLGLALWQLFNARRDSERLFQRVCALEKGFAVRSPAHTVPLEEVRCQGPDGQSETLKEIEARTRKLRDAYAINQPRAAEDLDREHIDWALSEAAQLLRKNATDASDFEIEVAGILEQHIGSTARVRKA